MSSISTIQNYHRQHQSHAWKKDRQHPKVSYVQPSEMGNTQWCHLLEKTITWNVIKLWQWRQLWCTSVTPVLYIYEHCIEYPQANCHMSRQVMWGTPNCVACLTWVPKLKLSNPGSRWCGSTTHSDVNNTQRCHLPHLLTVRQPLVVTKQATYFADCHANHLLLLVVVVVIVLDGLLSML